MTVPDGLAVHADIANVAPMTGAWSELADSCGAGPLVRPDYSLPWWEHRGRGELHVVTVHQDGQLVALAPLHERRYGAIGVLRWLGHGLGTIGELLVRPGYDAAGDRIWSSVGTGRRALQLVEYRHAGGGLLALRRSPEWTSLLRVRNLCPTVDVPAGGSGELIGSRSNLRRTLAAADRQLGKAHTCFTIDAVTDRAALIAQLPRLVTLAAAADADGKRTNLFAAPWYDFTASVIQRMSESGSAVLFLGQAGDSLVSFDLAFHIGDTLTLWVGRIDPDARGFSPGHLAMGAIVDWCAARGVTRIDMLLGDHDYKRRWSTGSYDTLGVTAVRPRSTWGRRES